MRRRLALPLIVLSAALAACSGTSPSVMSPDAAGVAPTQDAATRSQPVVAGRAARVFVFAGVGQNCELVAEPQVNVTITPAKGDLSIVHGQDTTIQSSLLGTCLGAKAKGTGVYYTARAGATGTDRFTVQARLASGETATRNFEVTIAE